jgi:hypothetical protein
MKVSFFKSAVLVLGVVAMLSACKREKAADVLVSLGSSSTSFANGQAELVVSLSGKSTSAVSATISAAGTLPTSALSFNGNVSIAAGSTQASVPVTVNTDGLEAGSYEAVFTIASVSGAQLNASKSSVTLGVTVEAPAPVPSVVTISSYDEEFTEGKATITLGLDKASANDVKVTFELQTEYEGYNVLGADALSFENPVTIPAGELTKSVVVTVDESKVVPGDNLAGITIASVEGGDKGTTKLTAWISITGALVAEEVEGWSVSYDSREAATNGTVYDWILVQGWTGEYFDVAIYAEGALAYFKNDMLALMQYRHDNYAGKYIGQYTIDQVLYSKAGYVNFSLLDPGNYEVYLIDYKADGTFTGKYAKNVFTIEQEDASEAYTANLGTYALAAEGVATTTELKSYINNTSYKLVFGDDYYGYEVVLDWDETANTFTLKSQLVDEYENQNYGPVEDYVWGWRTNSSTNKPGPITGTGYGIGTATAAEGVITFADGLDVTLSDNSSVHLEGFGFYGSILEGEYAGYYLTYTGLTAIAFPATLTKQSASAGAPARNVTITDLGGKVQARGFRTGRLDRTYLQSR